MLALYLLHCRSWIRLDYRIVCYLIVYSCISLCFISPESCTSRKGNGTFTPSIRQVLCMMHLILIQCPIHYCCECIFIHWHSTVFLIICCIHYHNHCHHQFLMPNIGQQRVQINYLHSCLYTVFIFIILYHFNIHCAILSIYLLYSFCQEICLCSINTHYTLIFI